MPSLDLEMGVSGTRNRDGDEAILEVEACNNVECVAEGTELLHSASSVTQIGGQFRNCNLSFSDTLKIL